MSRIGKKQITIPSGVNATLEGSVLSVVGPKGTLSECKFATRWFEFASNCCFDVWVGRVAGISNVLLI